MTADRDYYSGAFLDWFPGNIQHLNSIACVLQCPPAAQQQYNETAGRAEQSRDSETRHFAAHSSLQCGKAVIAIVAVTCFYASYVTEDTLNKHVISLFACCIF